MATTVHRPRAATPERWQRALGRAIAGNVQVRQVGSTGQWVATSTSDATAAHELMVINGVAVGCSCPAGQFDDAVCAHRAAYWHTVGILDLIAPEPAPALQTVRCPDCLGDGFLKIMVGDRFSDWVPGTCHRCGGVGEVQVLVEVLAA